MLDDHSPILTSLFSAVSAHLSGDTRGTQIVLTDVVTSGRSHELACAAAMAAGEYLRDAADARGLPALRMLDILCSAHASMTSDAPPSCEGLILAGARSYLSGSGALWSVDQTRALGADPYRVAFAAVSVAAASLTWKATDLGLSAQDVARRTCLSMAARQCQPAT